MGTFARCSDIGLPLAQLLLVLASCSRHPTAAIPHVPTERHSNSQAQSATALPDDPAAAQPTAPAKTPIIVQPSPVQSPMWSALPPTRPPDSPPLPATLTVNTPDNPDHPAAMPDGVCQEPVDDYTRIAVNGEPVNERTALMLNTAVAIYRGPGDLRRVVQGSYNDDVAASFGTHAGGGVVDISIRSPDNPSERLFGEVEAMVRALREAGFAAWYREANEVETGSVPHIHAVAVGDKELSMAAQEQLVGPHGYFRGMNGLPRDPQPDRHGGPVLCPWMLKAGYEDLRETPAPPSE